MRNLTNIGASILLTSFLCLTASVQALDWPQWRGPLRDGISQETGLLKEWPKDGPRLIWQKDKLGVGYSTPAVVGNRIYLVGNTGLEAEFVQALNAADGELVWSTPIGKVGNPDQNPPYPAARSTPIVDGEFLYVLGSDGDLACLDAESGQPQWKKNLRTDFAGKPGEWAYAESPLIDGDVLVCTPGGSEATIVALHKNDGSVIWKSPIKEADDAAYSSIVVANVAGVKQYIQFLSKGIVGVDAATGSELWRYDRTAVGSPANIPTPLIYGDYVYTASGKGGCAAIKIKQDAGKLVAEEIYFDKTLPKAIGGALRVGDYLYGTSDALMCVDFKTGKSKWRERAIGAASVCFAEGNLYLHGENGDVALVEATPEGYREKGRFTPPNRPDSGKSKAWAYPVVSNGKLYIFDFGTLWCYDVRSGEK